MQYKGSMDYQSCTHSACNSDAVVGDKYYGNALCLAHLHTLRSKEWSEVYTCKITGTLLEAVEKYIREQFPDCDKAVAPLRVGCNTIRYDAGGILADGNRVTEAELDAMLTKVRELKAEAAKRKEAGAGKQRVWWAVFPSKDNTYYPRNHRDEGIPVQSTLQNCIYQCHGAWECRPVDAEGNEIEVRWRAKRKSDGVWCAGGQVYKTQQEHLRIIRQDMWDSVPVLASNKDIELDLCLGGATWEPAA